MARFIGHHDGAMYKLIVLTIAGAVIIGFCGMFALFTYEWNDS
jgi:hypothetical protein